jgi:hypothetical protein
MPPVFVVYRCGAGWRSKGMEGMRFVIGGVNQGDAVCFQAIPEGECGMVQVLGGDTDTSEVKYPLCQIVKMHLSLQRLERDREILVGHLSGETRLQLLAAASGCVEFPDVAGDEQRREERKPLDVIPVGVPNEKMAMDWGRMCR